MWTVYKHTFPNGKVYIGITSRNPKDRWGSNGTRYRHNSLMMRAIKKYDWNNISHEIIKEGLTQEEACKLEIEMIAEYQSYKREYGYNFDKGGSGFNMTESQKAEQSEKMKRLWQNEEYRTKHIKALKDYWTPEIREQWSGENHRLYGKHLSEDTKQKLSASAKKNKVWEYMLTPEAKAKNIKIVKARCCVPVMIYTSDGTEWFFSSGAEAERQFGVNKSTIVRHCKTKTVTQNGLYCEYARESETGRRLIPLLVPPIEQ